MTVPEPALRDPPILRQSDVTPRYRLRSEKAVEGTNTWEVQWQLMPPASGPPVVRRLSRERFQALDGTGLLDSRWPALDRRPATTVEQRGSRTGASKLPFEAPSLAMANLCERPS